MTLSTMADSNNPNDPNDAPLARVGSGAPVAAAVAVVPAPAPPLPPGTPAPSDARPAGEAPPRDPMTTRREIILSQMLEGSKRDLQRQVLAHVLEDAASQKARAEKLERERDEARADVQTLKVKMERLTGKLRSFRKALYVAEVMVIFGGLLVALGGALLGINPLPFAIIMGLGILMVLCSYLLKRKEILKDTSGED